MADITGTKVATQIPGSVWPKPPGPNGSNGNGRRKWFGRDERFSKDTYRIMMWILLGGIVMAFGALAVGYIYLSVGGNWQSVRIPRTFIVSTVLILVSSVTMQAARRHLSSNDTLGYARWLWVTLFLGVAFVGSQIVAWQKLVAEGVYLSGNPHASFFYLFTGAHGIHLLGGITALSYLTLRARRVLIGVANEKRAAATDAVTLYWHFMDGLWVCLFLLLLLWN